MVNSMEQFSTFVQSSFSQIKNFKTNWKNKNQYQKYQSFYNYLHFLGADIFNYEVFKRRPNGSFVYFLLAIGVWSYFLVLYTLVHYISIGEFIKAIPTFCMFGIMTSTYAAASNMLLEKRMKWIPLLEMLGTDILLKYKRPTAYTRICSEGLDDMVKSYIIKIAVIQLSFVLALAGPLYTYVRDGTFVTLYETRIPFLQHDPNIEFIINISWQTFISLMGIPALFLIEGLSSLVDATISITSKLSALELTELSKGLEAENIEMEEASQSVKRIITQILQIEEYVKNFGEMWYWRLFLAPPTFLFSISVSVFPQFVLGYPAGFGIAVVCYVQMAILCDIGQNVIDRNNRLLEALYEFKWFLLPMKDQKEILFMIHHLQNRHGLRMGPFETLNYQTLKFLTQKVYSLTMFLIQFNG